MVRPQQVVSASELDLMVYSVAPRPLFCTHKAPQQRLSLRAIAILVRLRSGGRQVCRSDKAWQSMPATSPRDSGCMHTRGHWAAAAALWRRDVKGP
jgi:hypothetical protein